MVFTSQTAFHAFWSHSIAYALVAVRSLEKRTRAYAIRPYEVAGDRYYLVVLKMGKEIGPD